MERRLERILTICLGVFWLLDGILQLQPAMFTNVFVNTILAPTLQNQPSFIADIIAFGIRIFSINSFWFNLGSALIQLLIGALLLFPVRNNARRIGLWFSVAWALIIWIFGEGFGLLATGSATFYTGAPGSALLYLIIALCLLYSWQGKLSIAAGVIFLLGSVLNLMPMFWQPTMLSTLSIIPGISGLLGTLGATGTMYGNIIAVDLLMLLGLFLIFIPNRTVAWVSIAFLAIVWVVGQNFGGLQTFPFGTATDPNSAPLLALFILPIFFTPNEKRLADMLT